MLKKSITYMDLDGQPVTEDFYFNLTKAELAEMEMSTEGGFKKRLEDIARSNDRPLIMSTFRGLISDTVGQRSEDGKRFIKSPQISAEFMQTDAYSCLFMEFLQDAGSAAKFMAGVMPSDLMAKVDMTALDASITRAAITGEPVEVTMKGKTIHEFDEEELRAMPLGDLQALLAGTSGNIPKTALLVAMQRANEGK